MVRFRGRSELLMFGGLASKKGLLAKKGGAADVTPDALSYVTPRVTQAAYDTELDFGTFTGINVPINILIYGDGDYDEFSYSINDGTAIEIYGGYPPSTSITINNGDSLTTYWTFQGNPPNIFLVTLYNQSDNNAVLAEAAYELITEV